MNCPRCGAVAQDGNFCTVCGIDLRRDAPAEPRAAVWSPPPAPRLAACPYCGASNAASRRRCARCGAGLSDAEARTDDSDATAPRRGGGSVGDSAAESYGLLIVATVMSALVIVGVLFTILSARGVGPFASPTEGPTRQPGEPTAIAIADVQASSALEPLSETGPGRLVDGDPTTAWNEAAPGDGTGEWVELRLARRVPITRLLLWNGYQREGAFVENSRVKTLRIDADDRTFTVRLLDQRGPQAVDLPQPVEANAVRLTIDSVFAGDRYNDATLSEVQLFAEPG